MTQKKKYHFQAHQYFYQVQTQMHVAHCQWCNFVVWSLVCDSPFVERISYDAQLMEEKLAKAETFNFQHFLLAAVSPVLFKECSSLSHSHVHQDNPREGVKQLNDEQYPNSTRKVQKCTQIAGWYHW